MTNYNPDLEAEDRRNESILSPSMKLSYGAFEAAIRAAAKTFTPKETVTLHAFLHEPGMTMRMVNGDKDINMQSYKIGTVAESLMSGGGWEIVCAFASYLKKAPETMKVRHYDINDQTSPTPPYSEGEHDLPIAAVGAKFLAAYALALANNIDAKREVSQQDNNSLLEKFRGDTAVEIMANTFKVHGLEEYFDQAQDRTLG